MQVSPASSTPTPSVLTHVPDFPSPGPLAMEAFGMSSYAESSSPSSRRQRISMACQYCRHRKIRCCGGAPCRNCQRSQRQCDYTPVPEEINRATREKKAIAKAAKTSTHLNPNHGYSPYFVETPVFDVPYTTHAPLRPTGLGHRRSVSVPNFEASPWVNPPPAPALQSPAMFESPQWMYSGWSGPSHTQSSPAFPSVLEQTPAHANYLAAGPQPQMRSEHNTPLMPSSWSTPNIAQNGSHLRPPVPLTPLSTRTHISTPASPPTTPGLGYYTPTYQPFPFSPSSMSQHTSTSPTLAPDFGSVHTKEPLVGLGIGMFTDNDMFHTPTFAPEEYFASPQF